MQVAITALGKGREELKQRFCVSDFGPTGTAKRNEAMKALEDYFMINRNPNVQDTFDMSVAVWEFDVQTSPIAGCILNSVLSVRSQIPLT